MKIRDYDNKIIRHNTSQIIRRVSKDSGRTRYLGTNLEVIAK